jgi:hypothetical protein
MVQRLERQTELPLEKRRLSGRQGLHLEVVYLAGLAQPFGRVPSQPYCALFLLEYPAGTKGIGATVKAACLRNVKPEPACCRINKGSSRLTILLGKANQDRVVVDILAQARSFGCYSDIHMERSLETINALLEIGRDRYPDRVKQKSDKISLEQEPGDLSRPKADGVDTYRCGDLLLQLAEVSMTVFS